MKVYVERGGFMLHAWLRRDGDRAGLTVRLRGRYRVFKRWWRS